MNIYQITNIDGPYESYVVRAETKEEAIEFFEKETGDDYMTENNTKVILKIKNITQKQANKIKSFINRDKPVKFLYDLYNLINYYYYF